MSLRLVWAPCLAAVALLAAGPANGAAPPAGARAAGAHDVQALADKIDQLITKRWDNTRVRPAARASDSEFLRRVYLDLGGRIPTVAETRAFLRNTRPDKRTRLVDELLNGPRYVGHFTNVWRAILIPEAGNNFQVRLGQSSFESWVKRRVSRNTSYDQMVRELVTAPISAGAQFAFGGLGEDSPLTYYLAKELKPENLAASTARVFLGVSVECAQCHNHPFADWSREQFWGFAAFFSGIKSNQQMDFIVPAKEDPYKRELTIPGTKKIAQAKFLDGTDPKFKFKVSARGTLAEWITSPSNPFFARAAVNRTWAYLTGTGLVEPIDEMVGTSSTPSHPDLLDLLAQEFIDHQFDLKYIIRAITATKTYQLTSASSHSSQDQPTLFARMPLRGLTAEQLFDSVATATGYRDSGGGDDLLSGIIGGQRSARSEFLTKFAAAERPTEAQTSILQALTLMNGKLIGSATSLEKSETLSAIVDADFASTADRVEALYLATLTRKPQGKELDRASRFIQTAVNRAKAKDDKAKNAAYRHALADLFWALLNSPEFVLNH
jgi:hypothetical protein